MSIIECFFEFATYCTPNTFDSIYFFVLTTVLTRSISSFFSHDKDIEVREIMRYGIQIEKDDLVKDDSVEAYKFVFIRIGSEEKAARLLGQQRLYLRIDSDKKDEIKFIQNVKKIFLKTPNQRRKLFETIYHKLIEYCDKNIGDNNSKQLSIKVDEELVEIIKDKLMTPSDKQYIANNILGNYVDGIDDEYIPGTKFIAKELFLKHAIVYANILETGIFQYLTYSHRSGKKIPKVKKEEADVKKEETDVKKEEADVKKEDNCKIIINPVNAQWFIIPAVSEITSVIDDNNAEKVEVEKKINRIKTKLETIENELNNNEGKIWLKVQQS
ncbi:24745_t:CDS:1 [Racocetra persica]|uniref:24745_t:CDS:1 n=1 Tax=Racocetra persica TaxID=160502 RepID=A0ACA9RIR3_9GLOM|nr:24745_t:CDS:1 [Racocetra persica]